MSKNKIKLIIWLMLIGLIFVALYLTITGVSGLYAYFNSGADPRSALNLLPAAPADLEERLEWEPDLWSGRPLARVTRSKIAGAYLNAWAQWNISYQIGEPYGLETYFSGSALDGIRFAITQTTQSGWQVQQSDLAHHLQLNFYSDDGRVVAFTDHEAVVVQMLTSSQTSQSQVIETTATYDVVMLLENNNWHIRLWQRRASQSPRYDLTGHFESSPLTSISDLDARPHFVTTEGHSLILNSQPYSITGINYYPQSTPWNDFWPAYDPDQTALDLDRMHSLGINTVRIFIPFDLFHPEMTTKENESENDIDEYIASVTDFLNQAHGHEMKVIVTLFDHRTDHSLSNWAGDDRFLADFIPHFVDHPTILAWDLKNEADADYGSNSAILVQAWLRHIAQRVRGHDPNHLITIGWSTPEAAQALVDIVDIVSYHYYAPTIDYPRQLAALQTRAQAKPLLLQEFGLPTWNSVFPNGHTEAEQASYYADIIAIQQLSKTAGYMAWTLYDFESIPFDLYKLPWQRGPQASLGIIRPDGSLKPAAYLLHPQADLFQVKRPSAWQRFIKPFWLMITAAGLGIMILLGLWIGRHWLRQKWQAYRQKETWLLRLWRRGITHFQGWRERVVAWRQRRTWLERLWQWQVRLWSAIGSFVRTGWRIFVHWLPWNIGRRVWSTLWQRLYAWTKARAQRKRAREQATNSKSPPSNGSNHIGIDLDELRQVIRSEVQQTITAELQQLLDGDGASAKANRVTRTKQGAPRKSRSKR